MKSPYLMELLKKTKYFEVPEIGTFWPLITDSEESSLFYVEFKRIPPHYHLETTERFYFLNGEGIFISNGKIEKIGNNYYVSGGDRRHIKRGSLVRIPPNTAHELRPITSTVGCTLITTPPFNEKDEIALKLKE